MTAAQRAFEVDDDLDALLGRLDGHTAEVFGRRRARVTLEIEDRTWTVDLRDGRARIRPGKPRLRRATTRVRTGAATLAAMIRGETSGVDAFLDGHLTTRGNLALALQLEALFDRPDRPVRFPTPRIAHPLGIGSFYLDAGAGPPVVLLHGLGGTNASMLPTIRGLAAHHRVIAPDFPGFGDSDKPLRPYRAAFLARWVIALLDELGIERAHLVGNSMGGRVALECALRTPERVDRVALLAPAMAFLRYRHAAPLVRMLLPELAVAPIPITRTMTLLTLRRLFAKPARLRDAWYRGAADEFVRVMKSPRARIAFFSAARQIYLDEPLGDRGLWTRLPSLSRPALFIWGDRDWLVPAAFARHVVSALPSARSVVFEDCGHVPQFELPDETNALILEHFAATLATSILH